MNIYTYPFIVLGIFYTSSHYVLKTFSVKTLCQILPQELFCIQKYLHWTLSQNRSVGLVISLNISVYPILLFCLLIPILNLKYNLDYFMSILKSLSLSFVVPVNTKPISYETIMK